MSAPSLPAPTGRGTSGTALANDLRAGVRGTVHESPVPDRYRTNFAGIRRTNPDVVVAAVCEEDLCFVLRTCRAKGIAVTVRGTGHSSNGQLNLTEGGVLLVNAASGEPPDPRIEGDRAELAARDIWHAVESRLNDGGVSARVLPNALDLSIGGTISVGGFGLRSICWGAQVDNVESLRLVLPDGTPVEASETDNPELFRFALAGLGAVGMIEKVRMRVMPLPPRSRTFFSQAASWGRLIDALGEIAGLAQGRSDELPDELVASFEPGGRCRLQRRYHYGADTAARAAPPSILPDLQPDMRPIQRGNPAFEDSRVVKQWLAEFERQGRTRGVWGDYALDFAGFQAFMAEVGRRVESRHPGHRYLPHVYVLMLRSPPWEPSVDGFHARSVLSPTARSSEPFAFGCGLYHMVPDSDDAGLAAAVEACRELTLLCIELGGRPYLHGMTPLTATARSHLYGTDYARLLALRARLDPDGLFNPGWFSAENEPTQQGAR